MKKASHCRTLVREECAEFMSTEKNKLYCSQYAGKCHIFENQRCRYFENYVLPLASAHRGRGKPHKNHRAVYEYESLDVVGYDE